MMYLVRAGCAILLGTILWCAVVPSTAAQDDRTLTIRDGSVYVDGQQLGTDKVPDDLDLSGVEAEYQFLGIQHPVIELNGRLFAIEDGLRPVSEEEVENEGASVILQEVEASPSAPKTASAKARSTPQREYLNDVQNANRELYERLVRERTMERQAQSMARSIHALSESDGERQKRIDSLRTLLTDIFELKQENRRLEIARLQREIQELQRRLKKRKKMRDQMIGHRLDQLVGSAMNE